MFAFSSKHRKDLRYDIYDSIVCAAESYQGQKLFDISEILLIISNDTSTSANYTLKANSFNCAPDCHNCHDPDLSEYSEVLFASTFNNKTWRPGEVACSIIGHYETDHSIEPVMYELTKSVNYTFILQNVSNSAFVSQLYSGMPMTQNMSSLVVPFEHVTPVVHKVVKVTDVDNMPPIFVNNYNETVNRVLLRADQLKSCREEGFAVDLRAIDGDRFLDEEVTLQFEVYSMVSKVDDVFTFANDTLYCTDKTQNEPYIIRFKAVQINHPLTRQRTLPMIINLRNLQEEKMDLITLSDTSQRITDWMIHCTPTCYVVDDTKEIKLQLIATRSDVVFVSDTSGLSIDVDGFVIATDYFMESNELGFFKVKTLKMNNRVVELTHIWISDIDLYTMRERSAGSYQYGTKSSDKLFIGLIFGVQLPLLIVVLVMWSYVITITQMLRLSMYSTVSESELVNKRSGYYLTVRLTNN